MSNNHFAQQPYSAPQQPEPKKKHTGRNVAIGVAVVAVLGFGGCAALVAGTANEVSKTLESSNPTLPAQDTPAAPGTFPTSGILKVGQDIAPGEYRWRAVGQFGSYYARLSCTTGAFDCIITNSVPDAGATGYLTIDPSDVAVELRQVELTPQ